MANIHGFGDLNQNRGQNGDRRQDYQRIGQIPDDIPFMNPMRQGDRAPIDETIPYTVKLICCPALHLFSVSTVIFIAIWIMYIVCLAQGIDTSHNEVLQVSIDVLINMGGALGTLIIKGEVYRLITASFLHSSLFHIVLNSISLLFLLPRFEKIYPLRSILILICASISGFMLSVLCNRNALSVGLSTAIFGILGGFIAYMIINWTALELYGPLRSTLCCTIGLLVAISFLLSIGPGIDSIAHIGGMAGGLLSSLAFLPGIQ
jgi:membrane associated rhomboid family serine protease